MFDVSLSELMVIADLCLCEYTDHRHCGILREGRIDNDATVAVLAEDAALGAELPADLSGGSLAAGRHLLTAFQPPQGARLLERLSEAARVNPSVGHLATVFAARGQAFHLPFLQVAGALLLAECILGADAARVTLPAAQTTGLMQSALDRVAFLPAMQLLAV